MMKHLSFQIGELPIPLLLGCDCADAIATAMAEIECDTIFIIADANCWKKHCDRYESPLRLHGRVEIIPWPGRETEKSLSSVEDLAQRLITRGISRRSLLIAMGGGVVGNLTGMVAALLFRGIRFVHVPTTLLAMHDSVTSLKQGVNSAGVKNILGVFYPPSSILIDVRFLTSLPPAQMRCGLAELVKNALVLGGDYASSLIPLMHNVYEADPEQLMRLIELGVTAKEYLLRDDPHERSVALRFEYGHTIGHALELTYNGELNHGDCVAWGMYCSGWIARALGYMNNYAGRRHDEMLERLGELPRPNVLRPMADVMRRISLDNKRGYLPDKADDTAAMILLSEPGVIVNGGMSPPLVPVPKVIIDWALRQLQGHWESAAECASR